LESKEGNALVLPLWMKLEPFPAMNGRRKGGASGAVGLKQHLFGTKGRKEKGRESSELLLDN